MPTKTTTETALDQLHAHETAVLDADGRIGLLRQEEAEAIAQARQARQEVENYWSSVGTGAREHDEAELKTLACRCHELEQPIVKRAGRDGEVEVHFSLRANARQTESRTFGAQALDDHRVVVGDGVVGAA